MRFSWRQDWTYKVIAVVLSFALWLYVSEERHPVSDNVVHVPLETRGLAAGLVVAEKPAEVAVRVQGARQVVGRLTPRDLQAFVSLEGAQPGKSVRPVQVVLPPRVELVEVSPAQVTVVVEELSKRQLPLEVMVQGRPEPGYVALRPVVRPEEVVVSGPRGWLNGLAKAFVEANLEKRQGNFHAFLPVRLLEKGGKEVSPGTAVEPAAAEVFVPVVPTGPYKEVAVKVTLRGEPAPGYRVGRVAVNPATVRLYGSREMLAQVGFLSSQPVDIGGAREDVQALLDFSLPEGLYLEPVAVVAVIEILPAGTGGGTPGAGGT
ncbi:MAG: hypothetical protein H5U00_08015 [Clostridia bacterium]|nr:hypothetical protein [Clostridia bacterium]